jgi:molybdenum cofactor cytidylyltransferase
VSHKLLAPLGGRTVVERSYDAMHEGAPVTVPRLVVGGAVQLPALLCAQIIENPRWPEGQATSLWAALDSAHATGCTGVVVGLGDQPFVSADDWQAVFAAADAGAVIAVGTYGGRRRNPVYLHESVWPLIPRAGDEGARSVLARNPGLVTEVACSGSPADIDTAEDLLRWS